MLETILCMSKDVYKNVVLMIFSYSLALLLTFILFTKFMINEPPHEKTNKMTVRPAKTQISLGIRPV